LPIPSELDRLTGGLITRFIETASADRTQIASAFNEDHSFTFIAFAERMATLAVRTSNVRFLVEGLAGLVLEGGQFDIREDILVMAPLYDVAINVGVDPAALFGPFRA
jgi:hypothetical protein